MFRAHPKPSDFGLGQVKFCRKNQMNQLENLYIFLSRGENVEEVSKVIIQIYQNPDSLFQILNILLNHEDPTIRHYASVGLKQSLNCNISNISNDPAFDQIKEMILNSLMKEPAMIIRDSIIHAISVIIDKKVNWPQFEQFITNLFQTNQPINVETALKLLYIYVPYFSVEHFNSSCQVIAQQITTAISSNSFPIIIAGFDLFAQIIPFFDKPLVSPFTEILSQAINTFHQLIIQMDQSLFKMQNIIEHIIEGNNGALNLSEMLGVLLQMVLDPNISPQYYFNIFSPVQTIIMSDNAVTFLKPIVGELMKAIVFVIAKSMDDECFSDDNSGYLVSGSIETLSQYMNSDKLYNITIPLLSENSPNEVYASVIVFDRFIENAPAMAISNSSFLMKSLLKYLSPELHHSIREASLSAISKLIEVVENGLIDFFDEIIQGCIAAIHSQHEALIIASLKTLTMTLDSIDFPPRYLEILMPTLIPLTQSTVEISTYSIGPISSLIIKCEKEFIPYIDSVLPFIIQGTQVNEKSNPILKGEAIETLAKLISVAPEQTAPIIQQSLQLFSETMNTDDSSIISSLLAAFSILVSSKIPNIENFIPGFLQFSISQLDCEQQKNVIFSEGFDPDENIEQNTDIASSIQHALSVIENTAISHPEILHSFAPNLLPKIVNFASFPSELINQKALSALATLMVAYKLDPNEALQKLGDTFDEYEIITVAAMFDFCRVIIVNHLPLNQENVNQIFNRSLQAINHKLPCVECGYYDDKGKYKDDDEFDEDVDFDNDDGNANVKIDLVKAVFQCLSAIATNYPAIFKVTKFVDSCRRAIKQENILEIIFSTEVFGRLIESKTAEFRSLTLKATLDIILTSLNYCDGTVEPHPLIAIRRILLSNTGMLSQLIPQITEKVNSILQIENHGQPFFRQTRSGCINVVLALFRIQGSQFPLQNYFTIIFSSLPIQYEAPFIYESIIQLFDQSMNALLQNENSAMLIRGLAITLAMKDYDLEKCEFTPEIINNVARILATAIQNVPESNQIIQSSITDQSSLDRLQNRLGSI